MPVFDDRVLDPERVESLDKGKKMAKAEGKGKGREKGRGY